VEVDGGRVNDLSSIGLAGRRGMTLLVVYGFGTTLVALLNLQNLIVPAFGLAALVLLWVALALLGTRSDPMGRVPYVAVLLALVVSIAALSAWNLRDPIHPGYSNWYLGAITFVLLNIAVRGYLKVAWFGFLLLSAISVASTFCTGQSTVAAAGDLARQSGTLLIGTIFAVFFERSARVVRSIQARQLAQAAAEAATAAASHERAVQNRRLEQLARPALERIADDRPLDDRERAAMALLEAELRDGIRAAGLDRPGIVAAAREARSRGVQVVLVDDRGGDIDDAGLDLVEAALVDELEHAISGRITARLSPSDSDELATIVAAVGEDYRSVVVRRAGTSVFKLSDD
jgi:hypothetical protein